MRNINCQLQGVYQLKQMNKEYHEVVTTFMTLVWKDFKMHLISNTFLLLSIYLYKQLV